MFVISLYVFVAYQASDRRAVPLACCATTGWRTSASSARTASRLHLGIDGIAAVMILLNGVVTFAGTLISWKIEHKNKDFFILFFLLTAGVFGTFIVAGPLLLLLLLRARRAADVPAHRGLGLEHALPDLPAHQGIQRHEADAGAGRRLRAASSSASSPPSPRRASAPSTCRRSTRTARRAASTPTSRSGSSRSSPSAPAAWPVSGPSTPGRPTATSRRRPPSRCCTPAC